MTELEKLMEQKKEIENRIEELKNNRKHYGKKRLLRREFIDRPDGQTMRVSVKVTHICSPRDIYHGIRTPRYFGLTEIPLSENAIAIEYLKDIRDAINEYLEENSKED